jgi:hypothetical protein
LASPRGGLGWAALLLIKPAAPPRPPSLFSPSFTSSSYSSTTSSIKHIHSPWPLDQSPPWHHCIHHLMTTRTYTVASPGVLHLAVGHRLDHARLPSSTLALDEPAASMYRTELAIMPSLRPSRPSSHTTVPQGQRQPGQDHGAARLDHGSFPEQRPWTP